MSVVAPHRVEEGRVVALCGGVGGAKLALGLQRVLGRNLTLIVNTGDDFEHHGLMISPDIDTVLYTLSGLSDKDRGWGRSDESWNFMGALVALGGEGWFQLGDKDLALHVLRTERLRVGGALTEFVREIAVRLGIQATILPMSDQPIRTVVETADGDLPFQKYFVEHRCEPEVRAIRFDGIDAVGTTDDVRMALESPGLRAVIFCPSNPFLSVDPILATPGIVELLHRVDVPIVAVSPIIGGAAVKGPTAKIMAELNMSATSRAIAEHYRGVIDGLVIDAADGAERGLLDVSVKVSRTLMTSDEDKERLARDVLDFAGELAFARAEL